MSMLSPSILLLMFCVARAYADSLLPCDWRLENNFPAETLQQLRESGVTIGEAELAPAKVSKLEEHLRAEIDGFVTADHQSPPDLCQVLFVGSSSFAFWKSMQHDMAPLRVINRGFGGSHIEYVNRWFERIVAPYRPSAIVFYAGENDIAAGKPVERVVADFDIFMRLKDHALGEVPVYFISVKPSKARIEQIERQAAVNRAIRARADERADLHYIDVATLMLEDGRPKDIFLEDDLHMRREGYETWTQVLRAALLPNARDMANKCRQASRRDPQGAH